MTVVQTDDFTDARIVRREQQPCACANTVTDHGHPLSADSVFAPIGG